MIYECRFSSKESKPREWIIEHYNKKKTYYIIEANTLDVQHSILNAENVSIINNILFVSNDIFKIIKYISKNIVKPNMHTKWVLGEFDLDDWISNAMFQKKTKENMIFVCTEDGVIINTWEFIQIISRQINKARYKIYNQTAWRSEKFHRQKNHYNRSVKTSNGDSIELYSYRIDDPSMKYRFRKDPVPHIHIKGHYSSPRSTIKFINEFRTNFDPDYKIFNRQKRVSKFIKLRYISMDKPYRSDERTHNNWKRNKIKKQWETHIPKHQSTSSCTKYRDDLLDDNEFDLVYRGEICNWDEFYPQILINN